MKPTADEQLANIIRGIDAVPTIRALREWLSRDHGMYITAVPVPSDPLPHIRDAIANRAGDNFYMARASAYSIICLVLFNRGEARSYRVMSWDELLKWFGAN